MAAKSLSESPSFDFLEEIRRMMSDDKLIGKDDGIRICGGEVHAKDLPDFRKAWDMSQMPHRIWEYAHRIVFNEDEITDYDLLERGRVFGGIDDLSAGGDFSLRRDGDRFLWSFIGASSVTVPANYASSDFWQANPKCKLRPCHESALLWGEEQDVSGQWQDDRVGWADLTYPVGVASAAAQGPRVKIHFTVFTDGGQVAFVWWRHLGRIEG